MTQLDLRYNFKKLLKLQIKLSSQADVWDVCVLCLAGAGALHDSVKPIFHVLTFAATSEYILARRTTHFKPQAQTSKCRC